MPEKLVFDGRGVPSCRAFEKNREPCEVQQVRDPVDLTHRAVPQTLHLTKNGVSGRKLDIISSADDQIAADQKILANLEKQKRGLMQDLLTGRVRCNVTGGAKAAG